MRNPLTDPQQGDKVRVGMRTREVTSRGGQTVTYRVLGDKFRPAKICDLKTWKRWCMDGGEAME